MTNEPIRVKVPCRICYVKLDKPYLNDENGKYEYSVQCRMDKGDEAIKKVRAAIKKAFITRFSENEEKWPKIFREKGFFENHLSAKNQDGYFLRDGDLSDKDDLQGQVYFNAKVTSNEEGKMPKQPKCVKIVGEGKFVPLSGERLEEEIYSGCYAEVIIEVYAYPSPKNEGKAKNKGVSCTLKAVAKTADGERMSGGSPVDLNEFFGEEASDDELDAGTDDALDV